MSKTCLAQIIQTKQIYSNNDFCCTLFSIVLVYVTVLNFIMAKVDSYVDVRDAKLIIIFREC